MNMFRPLRADEIECRIQSVKGKGVSLLLYKDARCDQNLLDETVGPYNWTRTHSRDNANCTVALWDAEKGCWVSKEDTGTESNAERAKGLASDSFKRACFNWGIGRELYTAPFIWITSDKCSITSDKAGRFYCHDKFRVARIEYTDDRNIALLEIVNAKTGALVFSWYGDAPPAGVDVVYCERCGQRVTAVTGKDGVHVSAAEVLALSREKFGGEFCAGCVKALEAARRAQSEDAD